MISMYVQDNFFKGNMLVAGGDSKIHENDSGLANNLMNYFV